MSSGVLEVQQVLAALVPKVTECSPLDAQAVVKSLYGMKSMSSGVLDVRNVLAAILAALVPKIARCAQLLGAPTSSYQ